MYIRCPKISNAYYYTHFLYGISRELLSKDTSDILRDYAMTGVTLPVATLNVSLSFPHPIRVQDLCIIHKVINSYSAM